MIRRTTPHDSGPSYIGQMIRTALLAVTVTLATAPTFGQTFDDTRALNALRDSARAQERQADELRRLRQIEADRARAEDRARRNAARDSRSARRFD